MKIIVSVVFYLFITVMELFPANTNTLFAQVYVAAVK
jgi:hypothetical protein